MKRVICKNGKTKQGKVTVTLERDDTIIIIKQVPANVCDNCGEYYLSEQVTEKVLAMGENSVQSHAEVEILRYVA